MGYALLYHHIMTRQLRHWLRVPAGLLAGLVLLELALQLGARVVHGQSRQVEPRWLTAHTRILALGDSNTYGLYLQAGQAWPAQLQAQWNARYPERPIEVLNLGYPGSNSFRVRDSLPGLLDQLAPDMVFIMVGFNDFWTPPEMVSPEAGGGMLGWVKANSRLYRLYAIASRSRIQQEDLVFGASRDASAPVHVEDPRQHTLRVGDEAFYLGTRQGEPARKRDALAGNLAAMVHAARQRGVAVFLLTYPSHWGFYPGANKWLKVAAADNGVPLVDLTPLFVARCPGGPESCPDLLFHDGHATAGGNALVAGQVIQQMEGGLAESAQGR